MIGSSRVPDLGDFVGDLNPLNRGPKSDAE
jgi:hypothetical protein